MESEIHELFVLCRVKKAKNRNEAPMAKTIFHFPLVIAVVQSFALIALNKIVAACVAQMTNRLQSLLVGTHSARSSFYGPGHQLRSDAVALSPIL